MAKIGALLFLGFVTLASIDALAQAQCSGGTLKGQYVFTGRGFMEPGDPGVQRVHNGMLVFDGAGKVSASSPRVEGAKSATKNCRAPTRWMPIAREP